MRAPLAWLVLGAVTLVVVVGLAVSAALAVGTDRLGDPIDISHATDRATPPPAAPEPTGSSRPAPTGGPALDPGSPGRSDPAPAPAPVAPEAPAPAPEWDDDEWDDDEWDDD